MYKERAAAMITARDSLPAELRDVVHLRIFEQMAPKDIAAALGHSVNLRFFHIIPGLEEDFPQDIARKDRSLAAYP
jgi:hypothetical protein